MKFSADYVFWKDGKMATLPGPLPTEWHEYKGLHQWTDEKLAAIGWYPVERQCPKCAKNLKYRLDVERRAVIAFVPQELIDRTKQAMQSGSERMLEQPQHVGFMSAALGEDHYYSAALHFILPVIAAAISRSSVNIWCRRDADDSGSFRLHLHEQAVEVLQSYVEHYQDTVLPHVVNVLAAIPGTSTTEEVEDVHRSMIDFIALWPRKAGF